MTDDEFFGMMLLVVIALFVPFAVYRRIRSRTDVVRHPLYLTVAVAIAGGSLVTSNWFLLLGGSIPLGFLVARTRIEEEKLVERFGDEYRDYMARTGRFLPRLR